MKNLKHQQKDPKLITIALKTNGDQYYTYDTWFNEIEFIDGVGFIHVFKSKPYTTHDQNKSFKMRKDSLEKVNE